MLQQAGNLCFFLDNPFGYQAVDAAQLSSELKQLALPLAQFGLAFGVRETEQHHQYPRTELPFYRHT